MSNSSNSSTDIPLARLEFARRLRELRVPRGFRTARSLARALAIDENRYTRYERAEVEPDLSMIRRICETLHISPNTLLGADGANGSNGAGLAAEAAAAGDDGRRDHAAHDLSTAAWLLAETAIDLMQARGIDCMAEASPLAGMAETGRLYQALMGQPYEAVANLLAHPAVATATPAQAQPLRDGIDRFLTTVKSLRH